MPRRLRGPHGRRGACPYRLTRIEPEALAAWHSDCIFSRLIVMNYIHGETGSVGTQNSLMAKQRELERWSMARDEATRARSDVRDMAALLRDIRDRYTDSGPGRKPLEYAWVRDIEPETLAAITWRRVLARLDRSAETNAEPYVTQIEAARVVAQGVRLELTARALQRDVEDLYCSKMESKRGGPLKCSTAYGRGCRCTTCRTWHGAKDAHKKRSDPKWTYTQASRLDIRDSYDPVRAKGRANRLVDYLVSTSDLLMWKRRATGENKVPNCVMLTDEGRELMAHYWEDAWPVYGPMLVKPEPWASGGRGGYVADMAGTLKLVERERSDRYPAIPLVRRALDRLQGTAWRVNEAVYEYAAARTPSGEPWSIEEPSGEVIEIPGGNTPKDRRARRTLAIAGQLLGSPFYFPHYCDWRGRIYPRPDFFSIDSDDLSRGLLTFAEPKALGPDGEKWLAVHGANKYGWKGTFAERQDWVRENSEAIAETADNPAGSELLADAGEHYQFLAFCHEWKAYKESGQGSAFLSSLPCEQDASCNAIQHLAALWRRARLGRAVNLQPTNKPRDIYEKLKRDLLVWLREATDSSEKEWWLAGGGWRLSRALMKVPVMTLGYGVTKGRNRRQIDEALQKIADKAELPTAFGLSRPGYIDARDVFETDPPQPVDLSESDSLLEWITDVLWENIVPRELFKAREWFKQTGRAIAGGNQPVQWTVPVTGLVVRQDGRKYRRKAKTPKRLAKGKLSTGGTPKEDVYTESVNKPKQARALAANVVHSLDAAALVLTVNRLTPAVDAIATVHDAHWVRAADGEALARAGREGFHELHETDVLSDLFQTFRIQAADVPSPHEHLGRGNLEIDDVLKASYYMG